MLRRYELTRLVLGVSGLVFTGALHAQQAVRNVGLNAALVGTYQNAAEDDIGSEALASVDMVLTANWGPGELLIYGEGSTSPQPGDVSSVLGEVNGDAGSALDNDGDGRLQISELRYSLPLREKDNLTFGLLDTTVYLDATSHANPVSGADFSGIANDETAQFLGNSFVNNPIVEFPDYTLGAVYSMHPLIDRFGLQVAVTGSNGLADNPDASYSDLFDVGADGKGVFVAIEAHYHSDDAFLARLGLWTNTRDHDQVDGTADNRSHYGVYGSLGGNLGAGYWNARLGWSNPDVSAGETFISLASEQPLGFAILGIALAHTGASDDLGPGSDDILHAETFLRFEINEVLQISPDLQYIENSGFNSDLDSFVFGLRIAAFFSST